jgi:hypothetical protein
MTSDDDDVQYPYPYGMDRYLGKRKREMHTPHIKIYVCTSYVGMDVYMYACRHACGTYA